MGKTYVVVGGGIAGVTCVETLSSLDAQAKVTLVSASPLVKTVANYVQVTRAAERFDVVEEPLAQVKGKHSNIQVVHAAVSSFSAKEKSLCTSDGQTIDYDKLCICTGGKPKVIAKENPLVVGIRDTESVKDFQRKLQSARRVLIVGNGGIATELVYELEGCQVIWAIKDKSIANTFVDAGAGEFFLEHLNKGKDRKAGPSKRCKYTEERHQSSTCVPETGVMGGALGPDWAKDLTMQGNEQALRHVHVEYQVELTSVMNPKEFSESGLREDVLQTSSGQDGNAWPIYLSLSNGKTFGCDLVVSATGVVPCTDSLVLGNRLVLAADGGIKVNGRMETSEEDVYAAGDVCTANWQHSAHWMQMRLWSQARQMGSYAAKSMVAASNGTQLSMDFCFELFTHVTKFFDLKVILIGKFNAQGLGSNYEILLRCTKGHEYVKAILQDGRLVGAVLIGETDLEETFENLVLNGMDLTPFKENLLDPEIDLEDFFD